VESTAVRTLRRAAALRRKWQSGTELSLLGWLGSMDPAIAEVEVEWGYDGLIVDTEHCTFDLTTLRATLMAFRGTDCVPIVRVGANDPYPIKMVLDLGAAGVLVPLVNTAEDARAAVQACRYPPGGVRGVSPRRASNYYRDIAAYVAEADSSILVLLQIESVTAYRNLDAILAVEDVDCFFIGPMDLAASLGHMWNPGHPEVVRIIEDIIRRVRGAGRSASLASAADPVQIKHWLDVGANVVTAGGDVSFMQSGFKAFKTSLQEAGLPFFVEM
jgi:4-hydroxy-2-oxoheptanedioate aldolase